MSVRADERYHYARTERPHLTADDQSLVIAARAELAATEFDSIATRMTFDVSAEEAWETLSFYEQIERTPPFILRLLLPVPIRTEGKKSEIGDEAMCIYRGGHLVKRVTLVEPGHRYEFAVVSQELDVGGGMRLSGGSYTLSEVAPERTEVEVVTRYTSPKRPRWFWKIVEAAVCHLFHKHILSAMRREAEARRARPRELGA